MTGDIARFLRDHAARLRGDNPFQSSCVLGGIQMYQCSSHASAGTGVFARRLPSLRRSAMAISIGLLLAAPVYA
ncbi:hypothetical protein, partial [Xanthomonas perforans]